MNDWLTKHGIGLDDILRSSFTKLIYLAIAAWVAWKFVRPGRGFWIGYGVASGIALLIMTTKTNPVNGDKVFKADIDGDGKKGTLQDAILSGDNGVISTDMNKIVFW